MSTEFKKTRSSSTSEVGPYRGVQHLGEEPHQRVVAVCEAEPGVGENPVVLPVKRVQDAMLVDVTPG
jgi:hypothetical protein